MNEPAPGILSERHAHVADLFEQFGIGEASGSHGERLEENRCGGEGHEGLNPSDGKVDHEIDVVGSSWLPVHGAGEAASHEVFDAQFLENVGDPEGNVNRIVLHCGQPTSGKT